MEASMHQLEIVVTKVWTISLFLLFCMAGTAYAVTGISGQVTNAGGQPLVGITIEVFGVSAGSTDFTYGYSYAEGRYSFNDLKPGSYRVLADPYGSNYEQYMPTWYTNHPFYSDADLITVVSNQLTPNVNVTLALFGTIGGRVTDAQGNPIQGIHVSASITTGNQYGILSRLTNANGEYTLYMRQGRYRVYANTEGTAYKAEYYDSTGNQANATLLDVDEGQVITGVNFALDVHSGGSISGRVIDADGIPIAYAYVSANAIVYCDGCYGSAQTDLNGNYKIEKLNEADYRVMFSFYGYPNQYYFLKTEDREANPVKVKLGRDTQNIDFRLFRGGKITGRALDDQGSPMAGVSIQASILGGGAWGNGNTDSEGRYEISSLAPGQYKVRAETPKSYYDSWSSADHDGSDYMDQVYQGKLNWEDGDLIEVKDGQTTPNIDFSLVAGGSISGNLTVPEGFSLSGRRVNAWPVNGDGNYYDYCDRTGSYTIQGLPAGSYLLAPERGWTDSADLVSMYYNNKTARGVADPITVSLGNTVSNVGLQLVVGGRISGQVTVGLLGVEDASIDILTLDGTRVKGGHTDALGNYTVRGVPAGAYKVVAVLDDSDYAPEFYNNKGKDFASAETVSVTPPNTVSNINFSLELGGKISGRVIREGDGQGIADIQVNADDGIYEFLDGIGYGRTDSGGFYEIRGLPTGTYRVNVKDYYDEYDFEDEYYQDKTSWSAANAVSVTSGTTTGNIDLSISISAPTQAPTIISPVNQTASTLPVFSWTSVTSATTYELKVDDLTGGTADVIRVTNLATNTYTVASPLSVDHLYQVQVRGVNARGAGPWSAVTQFSQPQPVTYRLTLGVQPAGMGSISADPAGGTYDTGTSVTLRAQGAAGWTFEGWSGDLNPADPPVKTILMDSDKTVAANFANHTDTDGDGTPDWMDGCPDDANKTAAGMCGCGLPDTDTDGDGIAQCNDPDDDGDGMPDIWESGRGLNPLVSDASGDLDGDGYTNYQEYLAGTNPGVKTSLPFVVKEVIPHDGAGIDPDMTRVSHETSFAVRIKADAGVNLTEQTSIKFTVDDGTNADQVDLDNSKAIWLRITKTDPDEQDTAVSDFWAIYDRVDHDARGNVYPHDAQVIVLVDVTDRNGLKMVQETCMFKVETETEHDDAFDASPVSKGLDPEDPDLEDVDYVYDSGIEVKNGELAGSKIIYDSNERVQPTLGPCDELPPVDLGGVNGVGMPMNLQPPSVFVTPVKILIPCPGHADVGNLSLFMYNGVEWLLACDAAGIVQPGGEGWMVPGSRVNNNGTNPPTIGIKVYHFTGVQPGAGTGSGATPATAGAGCGGGCFVSTSALGSGIAFAPYGMMLAVLMTVMGGGIIRKQKL